MNQDNHSTAGPMLLTFLAGAAVGALVVALTTPKTGPEVREDLKALGRRVRRKAEDLAGEAGETWDELKDRSAQAASDLHRGVRDAAKDLRG